MPDLAIFTAPKPFTNPHIALIQRNAIYSWLNLGPQVEVILLGEEAGLAEFAAGCGAKHIPDVARNANGTPLVNSMFDLARRHSASPLMCCVNADILLMPDVVQGALDAARQAKQFLIVGQRYDLEVNEPLAFTFGWPERLRLRARTQGKLHRASGSDYFIFPRDCFTGMPAFAIGRAGWDNWMIYAGRRNGWPVIDGTPSIMIVHQDHDYSHLPGGQPHYRLPETFENVRLAGGQRAIFELQDVNCRLENGQIRPVARSWKKFWREVEIFPLVKLHSYALGQLFYTIFHPKKAYQEFRKSNN
ncbi:MAG: hypothetical protein EHM21_05585 [Chloroflexi bacterium]|nr:MAG: hypothetical protein EHM21_05585 [Chloroflexota bacterium]